MVDGWFRDGGADGFVLLGTRCADCSAVFFPREDGFCRNPGCGGEALAEVALSRYGTVWSYTEGRYRPPPPYAVDPDVPWEPYLLVAVELAAERMVVLGQAAPGVTLADLVVGAEVEVVPGVLGDGAATWHWRPVGAAR
ncbi:Zn-ribbon domain-containing OB-fold protein [Streptomyces qinzhouensis]|uniref:Benzoylsuccinyl-CoA thiolase n=1 Tax=Streptomyces qinzhouensis TaxID=2599401 RepID=A0A5B8JGH9_9ACTN|nr:benzoylsuccinyl-CoA thiolase [Streptomyces qinzhouensis]